MRVAAVLLMLCALARAGSDNPDVSAALAQIAKLETALEYEQALRLADQTIDRGIASRDQLADLHLIAGRLAAGLEHEDAAQKHFARALALRPNTQLIAGTSPKLQAPFDAARALNPELQLHFTIEAARALVVVERDPLQIVTGMRVTLRDGAVLNAKALELALPTNADVGSVVATDDAGNELAIKVFDARAIAVPIAVEHHTPIAKHWITYSAVSAAALIAGGVFAWRYASAQDEWNRLDAEGGHPYVQLRSIEDRGERWAIAADATFGVAAIAAVVSAALYVTRDSDSPQVVLTGNGAAYVARF